MMTTPIGQIGGSSPPQKGQTPQSLRPSSGTDAPFVDVSKMALFSVQDQVDIGNSAPAPAPTPAPAQHAQTQQTPQPAPAAPTADLQKETLARIAKAVEQIQSQTSAIEFKIDNTNHQVIVQIVNRATGELIRQIPPEEVLNIQSRLAQYNGVLFKEVT